MSTEVKRESSIEKRRAKAEALKAQIVDHLSRFPYFLNQSYGNDRGQVSLTWDNLLRRNAVDITLETQSRTVSGWSDLGQAIDIAAAGISRFEFERQVNDLPAIDKEQFDCLRLQFGAKAANLFMLTEKVGRINEVFNRETRDIQIAVPEFQAIPVDVFKAWQAGQSIGNQLRPYFDWANDLKDVDWWNREDAKSSDYLVRSSAVYSEDGVNATGAGIYATEILDGGSTFEEFADAVIRVYKSTDSPQARAYRAQHGIGSEEMGLVVQKHVCDQYSSKSCNGFINSKLPGIPQLMEVVTKSSRNFVKRDELDFFIALSALHHESALSSANHWNPDADVIDTMLPINVAKVASVLERVWQRDIQMEFVSSGYTVHVVQVRELPTIAADSLPNIEFPIQQPIFQGASIGYGDMELPVLKAHSMNDKKTGIVIFRSNKKWTITSSEYNLPREGAVIICSDDGANGHIQTLCAERGLICVFPHRGEDIFSEPNLTDFTQLKTVRVVSNGLEARVYPILK